MQDIFEKCYQHEGYYKEYLKLEQGKHIMIPLESMTGPYMDLNGERLTVWSINNYLGLTQSEEIRQACKETVEKYTIDYPMGSRFISGESKQHIQLEKQFADFLGKEASLLVVLGYMGMLAAISALVKKDDLIIIDQLSHACILEGSYIAITSSGARMKTFKHNDIEHLESILREERKTHKGGILIVTEGVFGMLGELGKLKEICQIKDKYQARLLVDDAHGLGVLGENGRGTAEHLGVLDDVDLIFGTFTKAFAAFGGIIAGDKDVLEYISCNAKSYTYTRSLPIIAVAAVQKGLEIIQREPQRRKTAWEIAKYLQGRLREQGFDIGKGQAFVSPVIFKKDLDYMKTFYEKLLDEYKILAAFIAYPTVPKGIGLFRIVPTYLHTKEDVDKLVEAFVEVRETLS